MVAWWLGGSARVALRSQLGFVMVAWLGFVYATRSAYTRQTPGRLKLHVIGNFHYLLGIAEGPPARRRRENFGRF